MCVVNSEGLIVFPNFYQKHFSRHGGMKPVPLFVEIINLKMTNKLLILSYSFSKLLGYCHETFLLKLCLNNYG